MDGEVLQLRTWGMKTALKLQHLLPAGRQAVDAYSRHCTSGETGFRVTKRRSGHGEYGMLTPLSIEE
jgi:hypothetical protein